MKKCKVLFILLWVVICTGCTQESDIPQADSLPIMETEPIIETGEPKKIGVYVDVTPSMQGFLGMQEDFYRELVEDTKYTICLDEINNIILSQYNDITYYRVDTPLWRTSENVLMKAKEYNYYVNSAYYNKDYECIDLLEGDGEGYESLCLTTALLNCKKEDFSVIVTDLYENKAASGEVIKALKNNMDSLEASGRTIGIVGIKSEFAGCVYDLSENSQPVEYGLVDSTASLEDIKYRQFYIIVIGQYDRVAYFCKSLRDNMNMNEDEIVSTVFFEEELYGMDYTNFNVCYTRHKDWNYKLFKNDAKIKINQNYDMDVYDYVNKMDKPMDIVESFTVRSSSMEKELQKGETCFKKLPGFKEEKELIEVPFCFENQQSMVWNKDTKMFETEDNIVNAFHFYNIYYSQEEKLLYIWFQVTNKNLPLKCIKFSGQICKPETEQKEWEWIDSWYLANGDIDYEKTKYLKEYVNALKNQMPKRNRIFLEFSFYINVKGVSLKMGQ